MMDPERINAGTRPGDPYEFQRGKNPFLDYLEQPLANSGASPNDEAFFAGTTTIQAADEEGWIVSVTPSGGWIPAVIAGRTGIGLSQRLQSFVLDPSENPYNVLEPGKRRVDGLAEDLAAVGDRDRLLGADENGSARRDARVLRGHLRVAVDGDRAQHNQLVVDAVLDLQHAMVVRQ